MPEHKSRDALAGISVFLIGLNIAGLGSEIACHMQNPECDYQFEPVGITATSSDIVVVQPPSVVITSS